MRYLLATIVLIAGATVAAEDLTLRQTIDQALAHSHAIKKSAALDSASRSGVSAARAERWPTLSLSAGAQFIDDVPVVQFAPGSSRELGTKETYQTDVKVSLPLYTGGRIGYGVDLARASLELQQALAKGDSDRVVITAWNEYLGLARAKELVDVATASQKRAEIINSDVQSLMAAGVADSVDLNDARLALTRAKLGVTQAENQLRSAEIRTSILLGVDPGGKPNPSSALPDPGAVASTASTISVQNKGEYQAAIAGESIARAKVHLTVADFLPTLSAYGGYSYGKPNGDVFNKTWRDYWSTGANLSWSFNLGGRTSSKNAAARYELRSAQTERNRVEEQLGRDARLAQEQLSLALSRYETAKSEYQIAGDQFRQAQTRHHNGDLSSNRLLDIETSLTAAQSSLAASVADYWLAAAYLYFATGSTKLQEGL